MVRDYFKGEKESMSQEGRPGFRRVRVNHVGLKGSSIILIRCRVHACAFAWVFVSTKRSSWLTRATVECRLQCTRRNLKPHADSLVVRSRARNRRRAVPWWMDIRVDYVIKFDVPQSESFPGETRGGMIDGDINWRRKSSYSGGKVALLL